MSTVAQEIDTEDFSAFMQGTEWAGADVEAQSADAGLRRYFKLYKDGKNALLMDMSRAGYEAGLQSYLEVAAFLKKAGIRVPHIYAYDLDCGLAIIENLGEKSFGDAVKAGEDKAELYQRATEILVKIRKNAASNDLNLKPYKDTLIRNRLIQFVDFYMPAVTGMEITDTVRQEFQSVWAQIERNLPKCPLGFCHADYHLENLIWCPETAEGYGLIDFQDAFWGFCGYDLLNLLEDARQTVPADIKAAMKDIYCQDMGVLERGIFEDWYSVLSAHFHCRVIGLFVKLHVERGMDQYLPHIPRLQGYISENLKNPALSPLKEFIERHNISLEISPV